MTLRHRHAVASAGMRIMRIMRQFRAFGGFHLFCSGKPLAKQNLPLGFRRFRLILPHIPHELTGCLTGKPQNMRIMRMYEAGEIKGFYLPCIWKGMATRQKHEADMRQYEDVPHVLGAAYPTISLNSATSAAGRWM